MRISIVAAIGKNRELGKDNKLLWNIPEDLKRFKEITSGHPVIMGRKTFESIGRVLPNRTNIIITRDPSYKAEGAVVAHSLEEALEKSIEYTEESIKYTNKDKNILDTKYLIRNTENEVFIIGGGQIFKQALPLASKLYLTIVDGNFDADTFFPDYQMYTKIVHKENGESNGLKFTFLDLEK